MSRRITGRRAVLKEPFSLPQPTYKGYCAWISFQHRTYSRADDAFAAGHAGGRRPLFLPCSVYGVVRSVRHFQAVMLQRRDRRGTSGSDGDCGATTKHPLGPQPTQGPEPACVPTSLYGGELISTLHVPQRGTTRWEGRDGSKRMHNFVLLTIRRGRLDK